MENELLRERARAAEQRRPLAMRRSRRSAPRSSEATGRPYGIQRVCQAWERSRSALYARQTREQQRHKGEEPARRGPTPTVSDATLLEAIQADLDRSPFQGEGHRKVHARLRILDGIRVARTRVLRVLRKISRWYLHASMLPTSWAIVSSLDTGDDIGEFFLASRYSCVRSRTCLKVDETGVRETVVMPGFVDE